MCWLLLQPVLLIHGRSHGSSRGPTSRPTDVPTAEGSDPAGRRCCDDGPVRDVSIAEDGIRLGQLLKLAGLVDSGADAKTGLAEGEVRVNARSRPVAGGSCAAATWWSAAVT